MIVPQRERERERGRDIGRGRSRLHALRAWRHGIRSRVSRIAPWAKGRRQTAVPPRDPGTGEVDQAQTVIGGPESWAVSGCSLQEEVTSSS